MNEAAVAADCNLSDLVDEIQYGKGHSWFDVNLNDVRIISIGSNAFGRTRVGQLMEGLHELGHAEFFAKRVDEMGYDQAVEESFRGGQFTYGMPGYFREEQVVERLARMRARRYLGVLSPQNVSASVRYINWNRQEELRLTAELLT